MREGASGASEERAKNASDVASGAILPAMAIPDYQTLMLPVLQLLSDGQVRRIVPDITDPLAEQFHLTSEDHQRMLLSGSQSIFVNRTHWAVTYLSKAGLLSRPARGRVQITDVGREALAKKPAKVNVAFLMGYPGFEAFRAKSKPKTGSEGAPVPIPDQNPEELLYLTYDALRRSIEADMLDRLQAPGYPWEAFERLVVELLGAMGYGSSTDETSLRVTKLTGDEGIDGVIDEDKLGLDAVYIQAKKYQAKTGVGRPALQAFAGSLEGQRASKGVFLTTSHFTPEAEEYVRRISRRIVLVDGRTLTRLMYDYGIGVRAGRSLAVKRVDDGYFEGEV
ncbi:MAG: mrr, 5-methylcytosine-specific restriction endonuclease, restriction system protein [Chloroflexi bacterium CSP1-4]|nr:MAG: mrr, 5-methylcytosine-specific restriction endonuclease, restriction system protein [Chloroflexi bacterium CSP1-4]